MVEPPPRNQPTINYKGFKMLKMSQNRASIEFEYEFKDGTVEVLTYKAPTTKHVREALSIDDTDVKAQLDFTCKILSECISGNRVAEMLEEQEESNIFDFKTSLDDALGKQKAKR